MKICFFGNYDPDYARNRVLIKGFKENKVEVLECRADKSLSLGRIFFLIKDFKEKSSNCDYILVGYADRYRVLMVLLAKIFSRKTIIWDAFYSLYDAWVFDRKLVPQYSLKALFYWLCDWISCLLSDKILLDTNEHINYFIKTFNIRKNKFIKVLIGADDSVFHF